jgi:peptidoglycan-N-acetylglucosamine deacetylase
MPAREHRRTLLLSIDFEDWHQLVRRRVGVTGWQAPGPALQRQTERLLSLLDELGVKATFFILGMAARAHPDLVRQIAASGHEIGCHGDDHQLVHTQTPQEFAGDLRRARATIQELTGVAPAGYRAPAFSITQQTPWAYEVLAQAGFAYDASQHDSPRIRDRLVSSQSHPHRIQVSSGSLWEFPVAVWQTATLKVPVGGAAYWSALPTPLILRGLEESGQLAGLYLHPHELDPQPLRPGLPASAEPAQRAHGAFRAAQRNVARLRAAQVLRAIAGRHRLIPYGEAHAQLSASPPEGS